MTINLSKLLNLNLALEVGQKEARRPRRRTTRRPNLNAIGGISTDTFEGNGVKGGADVDDDEYGW
jgi:hypothetical protein